MQSLELTNHVRHGFGDGETSAAPIKVPDFCLVNRWWLPVEFLNMKVVHLCYLVMAAWVPMGITTAAATLLQNCGEPEGEQLGRRLVDIFIGFKTFVGIGVLLLYGFSDGQ
ncbi:MAG: hypothetical protein ABIX01_00620 [Chitinophagaceae bacterium]